LAWGPRIKAGSKSADIVGGLDYMATFASLAGVKLPENDRAGQPIIFDSIDMSPVLFGTGKSARKSWFYFTENELTPGAARVLNYKAVFNLRGDDGVKTGGLAVDSNLGWKGAETFPTMAGHVPHRFGGRTASQSYCSGYINLEMAAKRHAIVQNAIDALIDSMETAPKRAVNYPISRDAR
jgi:hypothetical protein